MNLDLKKHGVNIGQVAKGIQVMLQDLNLDDIVRLRKPHPCGGYEWRVIRLGADIGLECLTCGHRIMLTRRALKNRIKKIIDQDQEID